MTERQKGTALSARLHSSDEQFLARGAIWKFAGLSLLIFTLLFSVLLAVFASLQREPTLGVVLTTPLATNAQELPKMIHAFPDTTEGIHVFNDQLAVWEMSEAQFEFAASHYVGTQKIFASDARRFRAHNPNFVILNYRLGLGLGYQGTSGDCKPNGTWTEVIEGEKRVREYPANPLDEWFFKWQGQRVLYCEWGWYVMDLSNPSWREYWAGEVLRQLQTNAADGVFVDSLLPPNYYGADKFDPNLPVLDQTFEETWSSRIEDFIAFGQAGELADYYFIPNVGAWVTGRDVTDYSGADGVMVEGFGRWSEGEYFSEQEGDWQIQMDRILHMTSLDKIILLQQYVKKEDVADRLFLLSNYLLVKGPHTYLNFEFSTEPEWFPEYEIPIGAPVGGTPRSISSLWHSGWEVYARTFTNGLVLVNPSGKARDVILSKTYYQAFPDGGGQVPADGDIADWRVDYMPVTTLTLMPNQGIVLLMEEPQR
ncbi:MAG TPA: putative glycoside hydrolase [Anaerolineales bacterium]|nr:putative glycoside hydrolase [Anaerolineales bacterium]